MDVEKVCASDTNSKKHSLTFHAALSTSSAPVAVNHVRSRPCRQTNFFSRPVVHCTASQALGGGSVGLAIFGVDSGYIRNVRRDTIMGSKRDADVHDRNPASSTGIVKVSAVMHFAIPPVWMRDPMASVLDQLDTLVMRYVGSSDASKSLTFALVFFRLWKASSLHIHMLGFCIHWAALMVTRPLLRCLCVSLASCGDRRLE